MFISPTPTTITASTSPFSTLTTTDYSTDSSSTTSTFTGKNHLTKYLNCFLNWNNVIFINYQKVRPPTKDIGYIGCFEASNGLNAFVESINATQCQLGANLYSSMSASASFYCYIGGYHNFIDSEAMTIEMCIDVCIRKSGFLYAGISE